MSMSKRKFYKTVFEIEVLSEEPLSDELSLEDVAYEITEGGCSGVVNRKGHKVLNGKQAAKALIAQASDPGHFRLTDDGEDADD